MNKLHNWKCPKCGKTVKRYAWQCDNKYCTGERSPWNWLICIDNPAFWVMIVLLIANVAAIFKILGIFN